MSEKIEHFDAVIIGSGQGGNPLGQQLAKRGEKVALIERRYLGGTCVNTGCTPTKTMIASALVAHYARDGSRWGVHASDVQVDLPAILRRKDEIVLGSRSGWEKKVDGEGEPRLYREDGVFTSPKQLQAGDSVVEGKRIFIDTGARAALPVISGLEKVPYLTNESILELQDIPRQLLVLGAGYVGLEFAQMFRRFGSDVTVIQNGPQILPKEDEDITDELQEALEAEGIRFHLNSRAIRAEGMEGDLRLSVETDGSSQTVSGSHLLVAAGRKPNTENLGLEKAGIELDSHGFIKVNDRLETSAENVWALGDVTGGPAFTHISYNDFQIIYGNLYEGKSLSTKTRLVPYAVFTDPSLGRVGMTEKEARRDGRKLKIGKMPVTSVARARERAETRGLMKVIVDAENDFVLGAAILSPDGDELVQILSTLMLAQKPYTLLKGAIYIHPTMAEGFFTLMDSVEPVD